MQLHVAGNMAYSKRFAACDYGDGKMGTLGDSERIWHICNVFFRRE